MATLLTRRAIIVVTAALAVQINQWAKEEHPEGTSDQTFTVGLSATGSLPATHYWCNWAMRQAVFERLRDRFLAAPPAVRSQIRVFLLDDPDPAKGRPTPDEVLVDLSLARIEEAA